MLTAPPAAVAAVPAAPTAATPVVPVRPVAPTPSSAAPIPMLSDRPASELDKQVESVQLMVSSTLWKCLVEPLQKARDEVEELRKQLANYDEDKLSLAVSV